MTFVTKNKRGQWEWMCRNRKSWNIDLDLATYLWFARPDLCCFHRVKFIVVHCFHFPILYHLSFVFLVQNISGLIQCAVLHKKIVQNTKVITFTHWMVIRLNDEEGGMKDHQTIIIIYSQLLKLSRVKSNFHFWRPPQCSAGDANLPLPNFPGREKNIVFTVLYGLATFVKREHKSI